MGESNIFSEFDHKRKNHLFKIIAGYQTVITTTEKELLKEEVLKDAKIIDLMA